MQESAGDDPHETDDLFNSSDEDNEEALLALLESCDGSDEAAQRLTSEESWPSEQLQRLESKHRKLERLEKELEQRKRDCLGQMDSRVDSVQKKKHDFGSEIKKLHGENLNLREITESQANKNKQLADQLSDTTRQCTESETRVQFLVDRIVALLSASSTDQTQTDALINMRDKEKNMLKQLEDCRAQVDEVRQQNTELTSRLTQEQQLSSLLQEQWAEVEDRLFDHMQRTNGVNGHAGHQPREDCGTLVEIAPRSPSLGSQPLGPNPTDQPLGPRPLPEGDESVWQRESAPPTLDAVPEDAREGLEGEGDAQDAAPLEDASPQEAARAVASHPQDVAGQDVAGNASPPEPPAADEASLSLMEHKLRAALDLVSFECSVVREREGIYKFGHTTAEVCITPRGDVLAQSVGRPFEPIEDFIRNIAEEHRRLNASEPQEPQTEAPSKQSSETASTEPEAQCSEAPAAAAAPPCAVPARTASAGPTFAQPQALAQPLSARGAGGLSSSSRLGPAVDMVPSGPAPLPPRPRDPGTADLGSGSGMLPVRPGLRAAPSAVGQGHRMQSPRLAGQGPVVPHLTAAPPLPGPGPPASNRQGVVSAYLAPSAAAAPRRLLGPSPGRRAQGTASAVGAPVHYASSA